MTSRLDLRNLCRRRLGDLTAPYHWSDLQLNQWINDAIAEGSVFFPRLCYATITTSPGVKMYDLPLNFRGVTRVEYPPGTLLEPLSSSELDFWELEGRYDVLQWDDQTHQSELWISDSPGAVGTIAIQYLAEHACLDDDGDACTLHDRLLEMIVLFVRWAAFQELAASEAREPGLAASNTATLSTSLAQAERDYHLQVERSQRAESESVIVGWLRERVY